MSLVLITGAGGFIGRALASWLTNQGYQVIGLGHGNWSKSEAVDRGMKDWVAGDLSLGNLEQIQQKWGTPETVFHLAGGSSVGAALANPQQDFFKTVVSTSNILEWMRAQASNTKLVAVSSAAVYGSGHEDKISENAPLSPFSPYGAHKLMMETLCHSYSTNFDLQIVLPRLFSVYGIGLRKQLLWDLCGKFEVGGPVELGGTGAELRDWTHVNDVVKGLEKVIELANERAPIVNISTGLATAVTDIASIVAAHWGGAEAEARLQFGGQSRTGDPFSLVADTRLMLSHGIKCETPLKLGVTEYVDWFREEAKTST
jgi:UDP-glucose 4-epimerase